MSDRLKVLYGVQATGNGHISRCMEFYPYLSKYADVDVLLSGIQADLELPFPVKYKFYGWSYVFGKKGGVDIWKTTKSLKPYRLIRDIFKIDLSGYDLIINDFEPISAYARKWRFKDIECVSLSHQAAFFSDKIPRPKRKGYFAEFIFKYFAPSHRKIGFHFQAYDDQVFTPVIRKDMRELELTYDDKEVLVYLPSFASDLLIDKLRGLLGYQFRIFSKHEKAESHLDNIHIYPIDKTNWMTMLKRTSYAIMGAGFQGVSEMLFLRKKILAIPMLVQYEQECNAQALSDMGVQILGSIGANFTDEVRSWLSDARVVDVDYPNHTDELARKALGIKK